MLLYFSSVIDTLSGEQYSITGNMKPLYPKVYRPALLVPDNTKQREPDSIETKQTPE